MLLVSNTSQVYTKGGDYQIFSIGASQSALRVKSSGRAKYFTDDVKKEKKKKKKTAGTHMCCESSISVSVLFPLARRTSGLVAAPFLIVPLNADRSQARDSC